MNSPVATRNATSVVLLQHLISFAILLLAGRDAERELTVSAVSLVDK
jgi:hypothetical protein